MATHADVAGRSMNGAARGQLRSRTKDVVDDFTELRKDVGKLAQAVNKVAHTEARHARARLNDAADNLRMRATQSAANLAQEVRARPVAAIGVSAAAGLLLGVLLARR